MRLALLAVAAALGVAACAGVIDNCPEGLRPPPMGGWDHHGPG